MVTNDVKIYSAARRDSAPQLPLREELEIIAIECVYEPKKKKNLSGGILRHNTIDKERSKADVGSVESRKQNKSFWSYFRRNQNSEDEFSQSTVSAITMHTLDELKEKEAIDASLSARVETGTTTSNSIYSDIATYAEGKNNGLYEANGMDDMTISIVALVGSENQANMKPEVIFTSANGEESTKWWYEKEEERLEDHGDLCSCSCVDVKSLVESVQSLFIPSKFDFDNYDLKLEVDTENENTNKAPSNPYRDSISLNTIDRFLLSEQSIEDKVGSVDSAQRSEDEERNPLESFANSPDRKTLRKNAETSFHESNLSTSRIGKSFSLDSNSTKQKILDLKNAQLVKYKVAQSTLEDDFIDKDEAESIYAKMMQQIAHIGDEIKQLVLIDVDEEEDILYEVDDSIADVENKIAKQKIKLTALANEHEIYL